MIMKVVCKYNTTKYGKMTKYIRQIIRLCKYYTMAYTTILQIVYIRRLLNMCVIVCSLPIKCINLLNFMPLL